MPRIHHRLDIEREVKISSGWNSHLAYTRYYHKNFYFTYRVRTWSCHPLSKAIFKYQNMCCTKIPLKILPGIRKSILKNSWMKIGKNFSVFSVKMKFWKMFEFVLWKYIKSLIFSTQYGCIAVSQIKPNFTIFCAYGPSWRGPNGVNYILNYFCTQCLDI